MGALSGTQSALTSIINRQQKDKDWVKAFALSEYIDKRTYDRTIKATELKHSRGVKAATHASQTDVFKVGIANLNSDLKGINSRLKELTDVFAYNKPSQDLYLAASGFAGMEELIAERNNLRNHHQWALDKRQSLMAQLARHTGYNLADTSVYPGTGGVDRSKRDAQAKIDWDPTGTRDSRISAGQATTTVPTATSVPSAVKPSIDENLAIEQQVEKLKRKNLVAEERKKIVEDLALFAIGGQGSSRRDKLAGVLKREKDNALDENIDRLLIDYLKGFERGKQFLQEYEIIPGDAKDADIIRAEEFVGTYKKEPVVDEGTYRPTATDIYDEEDEYINAATDIGDEEDTGERINPPGLRRYMTRGLVGPYPGMTKEAQEIQDYIDSYPDYGGGEPRAADIDTRDTLVDAGAELSALDQVTGERWSADLPPGQPFLLDQLAQEMPSMLDAGDIIPRVSPAAPERELFHLMDAIFAKHGREEEQRFIDYINELSGGTPGDSIAKFFDDTWPEISAAAAGSAAVYYGIKNLRTMTAAEFSYELLLARERRSKKNPKKYGQPPSKKDLKKAKDAAEASRHDVNNTKAEKKVKKSIESKNKNRLTKSVFGVVGGIALWGVGVWANRADAEEKAGNTATSEILSESMEEEIYEASDSPIAVEIKKDVDKVVDDAFSQDYDTKEMARMAIEGILEIGEFVATSGGTLALEGNMQAQPKDRWTGPEPFDLYPSKSTAPQYGDQAYRGSASFWSSPEAELTEREKLVDVVTKSTFTVPRSMDLSTGEINFDSQVIRSLRSQGGLTERQYERLKNPNIPSTVKKYIVEQALSKMDQRQAPVPSVYPTEIEFKEASLFDYMSRAVMRAESRTEKYPDGGDYNAVAFDPGRKARKSERAVTQNTVGQNAKQFGESKGLGAFQMDVHHMLPLVRKYMGQNKKWLYSQSFSPVFQDQMFYFSLLNGRMMDLLTGEITENEFYSNIIKKWPSLPGPNQKRGDVTVGENRATVDRLDLSGILNLKVPPGLLSRPVN